MKATKSITKWIMLLILFGYAGTIQAEDSLDNGPASVQGPPKVQDPYEKFNRVMFKMNEVLDAVLLRPIAILYVKIVPKPLSKGLSNFYDNIDMVPTVLNDVLQANLYQATSDAWRFAVNSTVGVLGVLDVASYIGLEPNKEDFGLTLAQWGYKNSNYLVLPFMGPGTVRDQAGWMLNYEYLSIYPYIYPIRTRYQLYGTSIAVRRAELLRYQTLLEQAAIDKYVFVRDAFMQRRNYLIERNKQLNNPYLEKNSEKTAGSAEEAQMLVVN